MSKREIESESSDDDMLEPEDRHQPAAKRQKNEKRALQAKNLNLTQRKGIFELFKKYKSQGMKDQKAAEETASEWGALHYQNDPSLFTYRIVLNVKNKMVWTEHEENIVSGVEFGSKRKRQKKTSHFYEEADFLDNESVDEQERLWLHLQKEVAQKEVEKPKGPHKCEASNGKELPEAKENCKLCQAYDNYDGEVGIVDLSLRRVTSVVDYDHENRVIKPKSILKRKSSQKGRVKWFNGEKASNQEPEFAKFITFFNTARIGAHWTVSSVEYFQRDQVHIQQQAESNQDIRSNRKESKYAAQVEKSLGYYRPGRIARDLELALADFICVLCRTEFDFDYSVGYRSRSDIYCRKCFKEIKKLYAAMQQQRYTSVVKARNHRLEHIRRHSPENLFRPLLKSNRVSATRLSREYISE